MPRRYELTDETWAHIEPLLPIDEGRRRGRWRDHRTVLNGILWHAYSGSPWRESQKRHGPWQTCYDRFRKWAADGTFDRIFEHVRVVGQPEPWVVVHHDMFVDNSVVRAHQHATGARKDHDPDFEEPERGVWIGRS